MQGGKYISAVRDILLQAWSEQEEVLGRLSALLASKVAERKAIFIFGCAHAGIIAEEMFFRTGGLAVINPILYPGFMTNTRPITLTSRLERLDGFGKALLEENRVRPGDLLMIHSVSGRNNVPVEMAMEAKSMGVDTACITSLSHSQSVASRHPSGKHLYEVCDIVIDNRGVPGDALMRLDGLPEAVGPTSTVIGAALVNGIVIEAVEILLAKGIIPPVIMSANLDGGDAHNSKLLEEYKNQIRYYL